MLYSDKYNNPQQITIDYKSILARLYKTIAVYETAYPEVAVLKKEINSIYFNIFLSDAHLCHLQKICKLLDKRKDDSSLINLLHEAYCTDLELFKRGASINQNADIYF
ncbi:hypothetical protein AAE02nite_05880 [Adhaeribacter aerolatus]|uniref:Uncharacterized protein n=1 Tax=Adhaeribacter aerolatus TaxID=670289 RepID=A0A512AT85_9BACT|nr:hypothetical protein [Adhaeribacter aerolatus]GEO02924.1 hypothetical protein AAE02nite_05880 [Adhaeribacter aerolatus]